MYNGSQTRKEHDEKIIEAATEYRAHCFINGGVFRTEGKDFRTVLTEAAKAVRSGHRVLLYAVNADGLDALIPQDEWLHWLRRKGG